MPANPTSETSLQVTPPATARITGTAPTTVSDWIYRPHVDIFDTDDAYLLLADLPGADAEGIDVTLDAGVLTLQAQVARRHDGARARMCEYGVGGFHRRFGVDDTIDPESVEAVYRDGTLTVRLQKRASARPRRIPVSA